MNMVDIITKKRDGGELTPEEIRFFIENYVKDRIPDYQASALLMAIYFRGLSRAETFALTEAMEFSGDVEDLSDLPGVKVDKHSTGGVGDKTTLVVAPVAAAAGVTVAKMSGRGLGFTGGTADKLEAIPGFRTRLEPAEFHRQLEELGLAVITQTGSITPADKKIYALRDVTGTVESPGLIASSIMSKKLAAGSDGIVLDVKCGSGALLKDLAEAENMADLMIDIGRKAGRKMVAVISDMSQPLGRAVGNALEVEEAVQVLKGGGPEDLRQLCLELAGEMIRIGGRAESFEEGKETARQVLSDGRALEKFRQMVRCQGGDDRIVEEPERMGSSRYSRDVLAGRTGFIAETDTREIGRASQHLGAGRLRKEDEIDFTAGIRMHVRIGNFVKEGDVLATLYGADSRRLEEAEIIMEAAIRILAEPTAPPKLIQKIIQ
ncbi:pyrimidine-nucleoside phosphorylase [Mogibacterium kristiansenii]|uniref:pyrimidine-nucleoside phosphorylase n=1 Tax=Mogibacterium kristiansenii TaxID=2606708 RepID=UPI0024097612|nr:pyrimidine-nucleoside phosphorylase [Mogibacterium kristiansenii]MDD6700060.1 pyrimidine-nucleoside phosphorylase [Mogibacterium kristiansenii]